MKKLTDKQKKILIVIAAVLIVIFVITNRGRLNHNREIKKETEINVTDAATDFHISSKSILIWDNKTLYFCDKDGELFKKITRKEDDLQIFFANNYVFLYDKDLRKLFEYSELGEHLNTIKVPTDVFNIKYQNKNIIIQGKDADTEYLYNLKADGNLEEFYKTDNYILSFDVQDVKDNFAVAEINTSATGYKNILTAVIDGDRIIKEYSSEVGLFVSIGRNEATLITDKNMYRVSPDESFHRNIPNISDVLVDGNNIYLLHSGIVSEYNKKLEETHKYILAANVEKITKVSSSIYVYGKNDIGGEIGTKNEFYTRIGSSVDKVEINGLTIGALSEGKVTIYRIINSRNYNKNTLTDLTKEQDN